MTNGKRDKKERPSLPPKAQFTHFAVKESGELMDFLLKKMEGASRTTVKSLLTKRQVLVNNHIITQYNFSLHPGMEVKVSKYKGQKEFRNKFIRILYEDGYLLVVEKKEGIPTIASDNKKIVSAHTILNDHVKRSHKNNKVHVVHLMDKEVSGLMLFAKNEKIKFELQDYWNELVSSRKFVAVVTGEMEQDTGGISSWINNGIPYVTPNVVPNRKGDKAVTRYKVIKKGNSYSLIELYLDNNRQNQIRYHLHETGHTIVGDIRYNKGEKAERTALHAFQIAFRHPVTGEQMEFDSPYPTAFKKLLIAKDPE